MSSGAALNFDNETDAAIRGLWQIIEDAGLPSRMMGLSYPPHMTLLTCEDTRIDALDGMLKEFVATIPPLRVHFHSMAVFNSPDGVIYLAPVVTRPLLDLHAALWKVIEPFTSMPNPLYRPGAWVPHVTLNVEVPEEQIGDVIEVLMRAGLPKTGTLNTLFIADFDGEKPDFEELFKMRLGGDPNTAPC